MAIWEVETQAGQPVLTHACGRALPHDGTGIMHQDIGGGYFRCERCGEKYLPPESPGNPRYLLRLKRVEAGADGSD